MNIYICLFSQYLIWGGDKKKHVSQRKTEGQLWNENGVVAVGGWTMDAWKEQTMEEGKRGRGKDLCSEDQKVKKTNLVKQIVERDRQTDRRKRAKKRK